MARRCSGTSGGNRRRASGNKTTTPHGRFTASAALSGSGILHLLGTAQVTATAALNGSGLLGALGTAATAATAALSGSGTVVSGGLTWANLAAPNDGGVMVTSLATGDITPDAGSVIIASISLFTGGTGTTYSIADTFGDSGGGSWETSGLIQGGAYNLSQQLWYRVIGTGPNAGKVTVTPSGGADAYMSMNVDMVTGADTTIPVPSGQLVGGTANASATGSVSLTSDPASTSMVYSTANIVGAATTPAATGFTEGEVNNGGAGQIVSNYVNGSGPQAADWTGLNAGQQNVLIIMEISEA